MLPRMMGPTHLPGVAQKLCEVKQETKSMSTLGSVIAKPLCPTSAPQPCPWVAEVGPKQNFQVYFWCIQTYAWLRGKKKRKEEADRERKELLNIAQGLHFSGHVEARVVQTCPSLLPHGSVLS